MASTAAIATLYPKQIWDRAMIAELFVVLSVSAIIRMVPYWE